MDIQMLCSVLDLVDNDGIIILKNNPLGLKVLHRANDTYSSSMKLHFQDRQLKQVRTPYGQKLGIRIMNDKACSTDAIPHTTIEVESQGTQASTNKVTVSKR